VIPPGLESDAKFSESLEGLRVIQLVRPNVFNFVLPKLLKTPMPLNSIRCDPLHTHAYTPSAQAL
jgi:hypothetical protein